jgi:osmotically-inducible protein OsmY
MKIGSAILAIFGILAVFTAACAQDRPDAQIRTELARTIPRSTGVTVTVASGVVTLTGTVSNLAQKQSIINIAQRTVGVRSVVDRIRVVPAQVRSDADIVQAVRSSLVGNLSQEELSAITVTSRNGVVTLSGTLASSYPKQVAGVLASWVPGVVDVRNSITVRPGELRRDLDIQADVRERFARNPFIPATRISVSVAGGVVTLTGIVDSFLQSEQAENVARFTPGVVEVHNILFVRASGN